MMDDIELIDLENDLETENLQLHRSIVVRSIKVENMDVFDPHINNMPSDSDKDMIDVGKLEAPKFFSIFEKSKKRKKSLLRLLVNKSEDSKGCTDVPVSNKNLNQSYAEDKQSIPIPLKSIENRPKVNDYNNYKNAPSRPNKVKEAGSSSINNNPELSIDILACIENVFSFISDMTLRKLQSQFLCKFHCWSDRNIYEIEPHFCTKCCWPTNIKSVFFNKEIQLKILGKLSSLPSNINISDDHQLLLSKLIGSSFKKELKSKLQSVLKNNLNLPPEEELDAEEQQEFGLAETFAEYKPSKLKIGYSHPDKVVETTSLSAVQPPDATYELSLPQNIINEQKLSSLQLEAIVYSNQRFEKFLADGCRAGFLIGDGAGVGKGRTIAGCIYENYWKGRKKAIWVSVSADLKYDAERDLEDIGASHIRVKYLSKMSYKKIIDFDEGVLFCTYMSLIGKKSLTNRSKDIFHTRMKQILDWCGKDFDGMIIFDESHKAKNLISNKGLASSKTGVAVFDIQMKLPKARVFYASATGASQPKDMGYMTRLGIWGKDTPFPMFNDFKIAIESRGVASMEMAALDLKLRGAYLARQLSFHGVSFQIDEVPLTDKFRQTYDASVKLWTKALQYINKALTLNRQPKSKNRHTNALFFSTHQNFFKLMCIASKISYLVDLVKKILSEGKCVVIGLQLTGEGNFCKQLRDYDKTVSESLSTAKGTFEIFLKKHFPSDIDCKSEDIPTDVSLSAAKKLSIKQDQALLLKMKKELLDDLDVIADDLPPNSLDELINRLGGKECVAELTGRKGRVVYNTEEDEAKYELRNDGETEDLVNMIEKDHFMCGKKLIAIISEAASSGISLQSDKRRPNLKKRVHITLELPWSADRAVQQFGRTHRSNQLYPPEYILLISELAGERRFASCVAKRLESLGALTHGDRRSSEVRDLSEFNIDSKYGQRSLCQVIDVILGKEVPKIPMPDYHGDFFKDVREALHGVGLFGKVGGVHDSYSMIKSIKVPTFLNRLLGTPVNIQNKLFKYFMDTVDATIDKEKRSGNYDDGILDLGIGGQSCKPNESKRRTWETTHATGKSIVVLQEVAVTRGVSFEQAQDLLRSSDRHETEGFYLARQEKNRKRCVSLALLDQTFNAEWSRNRRYYIYRPNVGQSKPLKLSEINAKSYNVTSSDAKKHWDKLYDHTATKCLHSFWSGQCSRGANCRHGVRQTLYYILSGSVFNIWSHVQNLVHRIQVIRLQTCDGNKVVGITIPWYDVHKLKEILDKQFQEKDDEMLEGDEIVANDGSVSLEEMVDFHLSENQTMKSSTRGGNKGGVPSKFISNKRKRSNARKRSNYKRRRRDSLHLPYTYIPNEHLTDDECLSPNESLNLSDDEDYCPKSNLSQMYKDCEMEIEKFIKDHKIKKELEDVKVNSDWKSTQVKIEQKVETEQDLKPVIKSEIIAKEDNLNSVIKPELVKQEKLDIKEAKIEKVDDNKLAAPDNLATSEIESEICSDLSNLSNVTSGHETDPTRSSEASDALNAENVRDVTNELEDPVTASSLNIPSSSKSRRRNSLPLDGSTSRSNAPEISSFEAPEERFSNVSPINESRGGIDGTYVNLQNVQSFLSNLKSYFQLTTGVTSMSDESLDEMWRSVNADMKDLSDLLF